MSDEPRGPRRDIKARGTRPPRCTREAEFASGATFRRAELLSAGPLQMARIVRDLDR